MILRPFNFLMSIRHLKGTPFALVQVVIPLLIFLTYYSIANAGQLQASDKILSRSICQTDGQR